MRVSQSCADCLYEKQALISDNEVYKAEIKSIIDNRSETDTAPYLVYLFNQVYERYFGKNKSYKEIKSQFNQLMLSMEAAIRNKIEAAKDPLLQSMVYARVGNYIDFGAMGQVDTAQFLDLLNKAAADTLDEKVYRHFLTECQKAETFLLLCDNCGEIVLDKLMLEQLRKTFPHLQIHAMVRGGEVLNDATMEDALEVGLDQVAQLVSNGKPIAGTMPSQLTPEAKAILDKADVILSKGQGNYESISNQGYHIFYAFLCKCELFTQRFQVPLYTGMFIEEV